MRDNEAVWSVFSRQRLEVLRKVKKIFVSTCRPCTKLCAVMSPQQQGQLRIAAPKPVYSALHHRSFVLQDVGELAPGQGEPREPERSGEPTRTSSAFQQPPDSFQQQLPVLPLEDMIQSLPPHPGAFAKSRVGSKTPPALFNPSSMDSTRQGYSAPSPGGRPLPAVPLVSQDSTSSSRSSNISHRSATHPSMTGGFDKSTYPRSSASLGSSASFKSPHTHLFSTPSARTKTPPSLINTAFPMSSDIMASDGGKANNGGRGGSGSNTVRQRDLVVSRLSADTSVYVRCMRKDHTYRAHTQKGRKGHRG
jgi:hypothetical protein